MSSRFLFLVIFGFLATSVLATSISHDDKNDRESRGVMETIKSFFSGSESSDKKSLPPKLRERDRVPKPPKYPLYDLESISLATPPPAPVMVRSFILLVHKRFWTPCSFEMQFGFFLFFGHPVQLCRGCNLLNLYEFLRSIRSRKLFALHF